MDIIVLRYLCTWRRTSWRSLRPDERRTRGVARRPSDREHLRRGRHTPKSGTI